VVKLKDCLGYVKGSITHELHNIKKMKGEKLETLIDILNLTGECDIYFNEFNVVFIDGHTHEQFGAYLPKKSLVLKMEIPEHNTYLWIYQFFNNQLLSDYIG
jgi:hypothetical protein